MSNLELTVEALKRCVPKEAFDKAMAELATLTPPRATKEGSTKMIHDHLRTLGMPTHIKGYRYTVCAVRCLVEDPSNADAVVKGLYADVAEQCDATPSKVERAIRHAIEVVWERGDIRTLEEFFGNSVSANKGKPTNSEFLTRIAMQIRLELGEAF